MVEEADGEADGWAAALLWWCRAPAACQRLAGVGKVTVCCDPKRLETNRKRAAISDFICA
jgi:hypothetical protein